MSENQLPPTEEKQARLSSSWIYRNRDKPDWWTHLSLTQVNPDPTAPKLDDGLADRVFSFLYSKDYLTRIGKFDVSKTESIPVYSINPLKIREFRRYADLPRWYRWTPGWILSIWPKFRLLFITSGVLIATSFFESFFGKWGDSLYNWIAGVKPS